MRLRTSSSSMSAASRASCNLGGIAASWMNGRTPTRCSSPRALTGGGRGGFLVGQQQGQADQLRSILGLGAGLFGDRGGGQVAEAERSVRVGDDSVEVEPAVDDAGIVQPAQVVPQRRNVAAGQPLAGRGVAEGFGQGHSFRTDHDQGVAAPGAAGGDEAGDAHAGTLGEQGDEPFVLDEVDAAAPGELVRRRGTRPCARAS